MDSPDWRKGVLPVCGNRSGQGSYTRLCPSPTLTLWDQLRASNDDPREEPEPSNAKGLRPWSLWARLAGLDDLDLNLDRHVFFHWLPPPSDSAQGTPSNAQAEHTPCPRLDSPRLVIIIPNRTANTSDFPRINLLGDWVNKEGPGPP